MPDLFKFPVHAKTSSRAKGVCGRRYTCDAGLGSGVLVNATCKSIVQNLLQLHAAATSENQQRQRQRIYKCFHHLRAVNPTIRLHYYGWQLTNLCRRWAEGGMGMPQSSKQCGMSCRNQTVRNCNQQQAWLTSLYARSTGGHCLSSAMQNPQTRGPKESTWDVKYSSTPAHTHVFESKRRLLLHQWGCGIHPLRLFARTTIVNYLLLSIWRSLYNCRSSFRNDGTSTSLFPIQTSSVPSQTFECYTTL